MPTENNCPASATAPRKSRRRASLIAKTSILVVCASGLAFCLAWWLLKSGVSGWIALPIVLLLALVVGYVFARHLITPLLQMRDAAEAMATGTYNTRVPITGTDEIAQLATSFNAMAEELEHADQMRKDLIANVSHELRTPVAAMQALAENMADNIVEPTPANLEMIVSETHRLTDLIAFLLDLSRMEAGAASLEITRFDFKEFLEGTAKPLEIADGGHNHRVQIDVPDKLDIEADENRLHQLFTNIISNAMKHSPDDTDIVVECHADDAADTIVTNVVDYGSTIAPESREAIFRRFIRGKQPGTSSGGTGLGLPIARWAARLHGGDVTVVDDPRGADFMVTLPRHHQDAADGSSPAANANGG